MPVEMSIILEEWTLSINEIIDRDTSNKISSLISRIRNPLEMSYQTVETRNDRAAGDNHCHPLFISLFCGCLFVNMGLHFTFALWPRLFRRSWGTERIKTDIALALLQKPTGDKGDHPDLTSVRKLIKKIDNLIIDVRGEESKISLCSPLCLLIYLK